MNERIRELVRESHLDVYGLGKDRYKWESTVDKFAKLIIEECGDVAYRAFWDNPETVRGIHIKQKIKEHFGVDK